MAATFVGQAGVNARSDDCAVHTDCVAGDLVVAVAGDASLDSNAFDAPAQPLEDANNGSNVGFGSGFDVVADNTYVFTAAVADRHRTRTFAFRDAGGVTSRDPTFEGADTSAAFSSFSGGTGRYLLVGYTTSSSGSRSAAPSGWSYAVTNNFIFALLSDAELSSYDGSITVTLGNSVVKSMQVFCILPETANEYDLPADAGSHAVTGTDAGLEFGRKVAGAAGAYAVGGSDASLERGYEVAADTGAYSVSGDATVLLLSHAPIAADTGAYAVAGTDAALARGQEVEADPGSYAVTGGDASLVATWIVGADPGSYGVTGGDAALLISHEALSADPGAYGVSGGDASLEFGWKIAGGAGAYAVAGVDAALEFGWEVAAAAAAYAVVGTDAELIYDQTDVYEIDADAGSYAVAGQTAALLLGREVAGGPGSYAVSGGSVTLYYAPPGSGALFVVKYWDGDEWLPAPIHVHDGSGWIS